MRGKDSGQLYRAIYLRGGKLLAQTYWAWDILEALERADTIETQVKVKVIAVKPLGASIYNSRGIRRPGTIHRLSRMRKEGIWPTGISIGTNYTAAVVG